MTPLKPVLILKIGNRANKLYDGSLCSIEENEVVLKLEKLPSDFRWAYLFEYCYSMEHGLDTNIREGIGF